MDLGNPVFTGQWIVPATVGPLSGQLQLKNIRELARGRVGATITDTIAPSTSLPGNFSIALRWIDLTRMTINRQDLEKLIQRSNDIVDGLGYDY